ncbi:hypothetical protein GQ472_02395 [archaeon]|nr:hypothetical protein [archaeon]
MVGSDIEEKSGENALLFIFVEKGITPERIVKGIDAFKQHKIDDEKRIQKYTELVQKDIIILMAGGLTTEDIGYINNDNIQTLFYETLSDSGDYTGECIDKITFYTNYILEKMKADEILEGKWFPCHGGYVPGREYSYKLSEKGVELLKSYIKEEKHKDALEVLNPF